MSLRMEHKMSFINLLEKLAELFPKQDYQSRLERYVIDRQPSNITEVEHWTKQFEQQEFKGSAL